MGVPIWAGCLLVLGVSLILPLGDCADEPATLRGVSAETEKHISAGKARLQDLRDAERRCHDAWQAIVVIDGGSSATRTDVFLAKTRSCPRGGRHIDPDSIRLLGAGKRFAGLRGVLESWLDAYAGEDWESRSVDSKRLFQHVPEMEDSARGLMQLLEDDAVRILDEKLTEEQKVQVQAMGVPVLLCSTAGVRDFHDWYREALFVILRFLINHPKPGHGYKFFTNPEWTRPITGAEEGLYAFLALNHLSGRLGEDPARCYVDEYGMKQCRNDLVGVVEVGGASTQIVFPLQDGTALPSSIRAVNLQHERFLPSRFPCADVISVSFMQLGVASSSGLFFKELCSNAEFRHQGICYNPCIFRGFRQACSAGDVEILPDGTIVVDEDVRKNKLKPVATSCSANNPEISFKAMNEMQCRENKIDPTKSLAERLRIDDCFQIVGTGDFDTCQAQVEELLVSPRFPLPANIEAASSGFESVGQVFKFASTASPMVITGGAMYASISTMQGLGLLPKDFPGDLEQLIAASRTYCSSPVVNSGDGLVIQLPNAEQKLTSMNYDLCKTIALTVSLIQHMEAGEHKPSSISWQKSVVGPDGKPRADLGWHVGAILHRVLFTEEWGRTAYETGFTYNM
uniref:NTPase n=1 Tax=Neospora caninum TaxID=29176 RepID=O76144_NEOCA|nr:NTPase [Neospora caninum]